MKSVNDPIDAELVDATPHASRAPRAERPPEPPPAPLHVEVYAWPAELRGRLIVTERGKRRDYAIDASMLAMLLAALKRFR